MNKQRQVWTKLSPKQNKQTNKKKLFEGNVSKKKKKKKIGRVGAFFHSLFYIENRKNRIFLSRNIEKEIGFTKKSR